MFRLYTPLLILQAFCLYHAYRNNAQQRWYWLIIFIPGIGCALYLFDNFYNRKNIDTIAEGLKEVVNSNHKLEQLEKALQFSDTLTNKLQLADAYVLYKRYPDAIALYKDCLTGYMADDVKLRMKLMEACYLNNDFESTVLYGGELEREKVFKNSVERVSYAWALHKLGKNDLAEATFKDMDKQFTNYLQRVEYAKFLMATNQLKVLREYVKELREDLDHMKAPERKFHRDVIRDIRAVYDQAMR